MCPVIQSSHHSPATSIIRPSFIVFCLLFSQLRAPFFSTDSIFRQLAHLFIHLPFSSPLSGVPTFGLSSLPREHVTTIRTQHLNLSSREHQQSTASKHRCSDSPKIEKSSLWAAIAPIRMEEPSSKMTRTRSRDASGPLVFAHSSSSGERPSQRLSSSTSSTSYSSSSRSPISSSHSPFRHRLQFALAVTLLLAFASQLAFADSQPEIPFDLVLHHEGKSLFGIEFHALRSRLEGECLPSSTSIHVTAFSLSPKLIYIHKVQSLFFLFTFLPPFPPLSPHHQASLRCGGHFFGAGL